MAKSEEREDPIGEEVRKARDAHARKFDYDLEAIAHDLKKHEREGGRTVVSLPPKRREQAKGAA